MNSYLAPKITIISTILIGTLLLIVGFIVQPLFSTDTRLNGANGGTAHKTSVQGLIAECGDLFTFRPIAKQDYGVLPENYEGVVPAHSMVIPAYGFMPNLDTDYEDLGENGLTELGINRLLWDGYTIIWLGKNVPNTGVEHIKATIENAPVQIREKTLLLKWEYRKNIPMDRNIAFSSWGVTQSCGIYDYGVYSEYLQFVKQQPLQPSGEPPILTDEEMDEIIKDFIAKSTKEATHSE